MRTGIFGYKGNVHYYCASPVNQWIEELSDLPKTEFYAAMAQRMDQEIHRGYRLYPCNYIAADELSGAAEYKAHYTDKITIPKKDETFLRNCLLNMYANPLRNKLAAE